MPCAWFPLIGEESSILDKDELPCLYAEGLAFSIRALDKEKKSKWSPLFPTGFLRREVLGRESTPFPQKNCKKMGGLQVLVSYRVFVFRTPVKQSLCC